MRIRKQPDTLAIITTTTSNRVLTHFPSIIRDFFSFLLFSFFPPGRERSLKIFEHLRQYLVTRTCSERNEDSNFLGSDREIVGGRSRGGKRNTRTKGTTSPRMMKIESNGCRVASRRCVDEEIEKLDC